MIAKTKDWFSNQSDTVKRLTIYCTFIVALSSLWGVLKAAGVDVLDFTIGCSSYSSMTKETKDSLDAMKTKQHWKWKRQNEFNDSIRAQLKEIKGE